MQCKLKDYMPEALLFYEDHITGQACPVGT